MSSESKLKYLVTGAAGFIGMYTVKRLLRQGHQVIGVDNLNDYYEQELKAYRLTQLVPHTNFTFVEMDLADRKGMAEVFSTEQFDRVIHLAAQAGVR